MEFASPASIPAWLRSSNPDVFRRLGGIRQVLFDFDGTLSLLRQGWEGVMVPMMLEAICGDSPTPEIAREVEDYVDRSTGILTIRQMEWLAKAARRYGKSPAVLTAGAYKSMYLQRLMVFVNERMACLAQGKSLPDDYLVAGARLFIGELARRGARLYLASGTDHADVLREAKALGLLACFDGGVYGALDDDEAHAKERVIQRMMDQNQLAGDELLIVGDGPVEIREGKRRGALTLGVASDELVHYGWNPRKAARLQEAGADLLVADFTHTADLIALLYQEATLASHFDSESNARKEY